MQLLLPTLLPVPEDEAIVKEVFSRLWLLTGGVCHISGCRFYLARHHQGSYFLMVIGHNSIAEAHNLLQADNETTEQAFERTRRWWLTSHGCHVCSCHTDKKGGVNGVSECTPESADALILDGQVELLPHTA